MAVTNDKMHVRSSSGIDDRAALFECQRYRLFNKQVLAVLCGQQRMLGVILVWRRHIDHVDSRIGTKLVYGCVAAGRKLFGEALPCLRARVRRCHQFDARIGSKGRQHHGKCAAKTGHADTKLAVARGAQVPTLDKIADILYP